MLSSALAAVVIFVGAFASLAGGPLAPIGEWFSDTILPIMNAAAPIYALSS